VALAARGESRDHLLAFRSLDFKVADLVLLVLNSNFGAKSQMLGGI